MHRILRSATNNLATKVVALVVAMILWTVVFGTRTDKITKEIPIEIRTAEDLVPANEIPAVVAFQIAGPQAFLRAILDRKESPIEVDLTHATAGLVTYRFFSDNIDLPLGLKVQSISPASIVIKLEKTVTREVPVRIQIQGNPPEGFEIVKAEVIPEKVHIRGARSRVRELEEVPTLPLDVSEIQESFSGPVGLDLPMYSYLADPNPPTVHLELAPSEANFRIRNIPVHINAPFRARAKEQTVTLFVYADLGRLKDLRQNHFYAVADLSGRAKGTHDVVVSVRGPEGVRIVKIQPSKINVTLY